MERKQKMHNQPTTRRFFALSFERGPGLLRAARAEMRGPRPPDPPARPPAPEARHYIHGLINSFGGSFIGQQVANNQGPRSENKYNRLAHPNPTSLHSIQVFRVRIFSPQILWPQVLYRDLFLAANPLKTQKKAPLQMPLQRSLILYRAYRFLLD